MIYDCQYKDQAKLTHQTPSPSLNKCLRLILFETLRSSAQNLRSSSGLIKLIKTPISINH